MGLSCGYSRSSVCRSSCSTNGSSKAFSFVILSKLITIVSQLVFVSSLCQAHDEFGHGWFSRSSTFHAGSAGTEGGSTLSAAVQPINSNCTKVYKVVAGETCQSLLLSNPSISQAQILELNPGLNCKTVFTNQAICVQGPSARCARAIAVTTGQTSPTCASIEATYSISSDALLFLNPGISCPEANGNNNLWTSNNTVCVSPGLGKLFFEYIGGSAHLEGQLYGRPGIPTTFADVQPLVQKYPTVVYYYILAFAADWDVNDPSATYGLTNGTCYPYWNSSVLTPAATKAFKAENSGVQILLSLGGDATLWIDPTNVTEWLDNAQASLTSIIEEYSIDGIDISYQSFGFNSSNFSYCMGNLINRLKENNTIGLATIAPQNLDNDTGYYTPRYQKIMTDYADLVDYVNFQFQEDSTWPLTGGWNTSWIENATVRNYIQNFDSIANQFDPMKLTFSTHITNYTNGTAFLDAMNLIQQSRGLPGVMLYEADLSVYLNFTIENYTLSLLSGESFDSILGIVSKSAGERRFLPSKWHAAVMVAFWLYISFIHRVN